MLEQSPQGGYAYSLLGVRFPNREGGPRSTREAVGYQDHSYPGGESHGSSSFNSIGGPRRGAARGRLWWGRWWWRHGAMHARCGDSAREDDRGPRLMVLQQSAPGGPERHG